MVRSEKLYSPQSYLELVIGKSFIFDSSGDDIEEIERILNGEGFELWNYPLYEIQHITENDIDVVLVECNTWDENEKAHISCLRWFELPKENIE